MELTDVDKARAGLIQDFLDRMVCNGFTKMDVVTSKVIIEKFLAYAEVDGWLLASVLIGKDYEDQIKKGDKE